MVSLTAARRLPPLRSQQRSGPARTGLKRSASCPSFSSSLRADIAAAARLLQGCSGGERVLAALCCSRRSIGYQECTAAAPGPAAWGCGGMGSCCAARCRTAQQERPRQRLRPAMQHCIVVHCCGHCRLAPSTRNWQRACPMSTSEELERLRAENEALKAELEALKRSQQPPAAQAPAAAPAANGGGAACPAFAPWDGMQHGLDKQQISRYSRQIILHSFGVQGGWLGTGGRALPAVNPPEPWGHPLRSPASRQGPSRQVPLCSAYPLPAPHLAPLAAQARLCRGSVLIIGAGGLGSPAALYLAAAGVGRLGIVDRDTVELSNIHRQVIHRRVGGWKLPGGAGSTRRAM